MRIGVCGVGTVGASLINLIEKNKDELGRKIEDEISIYQVASRRENPHCDLSGITITRDIYEVANNPDIDVLVELIGGVEDAKDLILLALKNKKHVVTANKALIAMHGQEIFSVARQMGVCVLYEAAVAGGIPIIKSIREGLVGNVITRIAGILNGTSNFILSEMASKKQPRGFDEVLREAQEKGYAEADPSFDVNGFDAAHKITILAMIGFGVTVGFESVRVEGISEISINDITLIDELGFSLKPLAVAFRSADGISLRVYPGMIEKGNVFSKVDGVTNAVSVEGSSVGKTFFVGPGAGGDATASSVISDLVQLSRATKIPNEGFLELEAAPIIEESSMESASYIRLDVQNITGVMASITSVLEKNRMGIDSIIQREVNESIARIAIITSTINEKTLKESLKQLNALPAVIFAPVNIRIFKN